MTLLMNTNSAVTSANGYKTNNKMRLANKLKAKYDMMHSVEAHAFSGLVKVDPMYFIDSLLPNQDHSLGGNAASSNFKVNSSHPKVKTFANQANSTHSRPNSTFRR
jgi:hypothetical protein